MSGSERFRCEAYACVLTRASCGKRWCAINGRGHALYRLGKNQREAMAVTACFGCDVGEAHAALLEPRAEPEAA